MNLDRLTAPVLAINSADDLVNPPELGLMEKLVPCVKRGRYILLPTSEQTRGHGTHASGRLAELSRRVSEGPHAGRIRTMMPEAGSAS
jgi:hypothetical protein